MALKVLAPLLLLFLLASSLPALGGEANVFVYHRFGDGRYPSTNISIETFAAQLEVLKEGAYNVLPLGEIVRRLREKESLPERCVAITVDDGYSTFLTGAMPLLRRYRFPSTLFVSTGSVGHNGYLDWQQLRSLAQEGVEIGNHTRSHPYLLDRLPGEDEESWRLRVRREIASAQEEIEERLGEAPALFAYPYGEYDRRIAGAAKELGVQGAVAQQSGVIAPGGDLYSLPRFPMGGGYATLEGFREKLKVRSLPVETISDPGTVVGENPPTLVLRMIGKDVDLGRMRCFVQGEEQAAIRIDPEQPGTLSVRALAPLAGRRSKYTLTAPSKDGRTWYWFSRMWVIR